MTPTFTPQQRRLTTTYAAFEAGRSGLTVRHRRRSVSPYPLWDGELDVDAGRRLLWVDAERLALRPEWRRYPENHVVLHSAETRGLRGIWRLSWEPRCEVTLLWPYVPELGAVMVGLVRWLQLHPGDGWKLDAGLNPKLAALQLLRVQLGKNLA